MQIGSTIALWILILLGGAGLWLSAADPIFGGPEAATISLTLFAFFVGFGLVGTLAIWSLPARRILAWIFPPDALPDESRSITPAHVFGRLAFWALALVFVFYSVKNHWPPVTVGLAIGGLVILRLLGEVLLNRLRRK
jgi:hypothetical protein